MAVGTASAVTVPFVRHVLCYTALRLLGGACEGKTGRCGARWIRKIGRRRDGGELGQVWLVHRPIPHDGITRLAEFLLRVEQLGAARPIVHG